MLYNQNALKAKAPGLAGSLCMSWLPGCLSAR